MVFGETTEEGYPPRSSRLRERPRPCLAELESSRVQVLGRGKSGRIQLLGRWTGTSTTYRTTYSNLDRGEGREGEEGQGRGQGEEGGQRDAQPSRAPAPPEAEAPGPGTLPKGCEVGPGDRSFPLRRLRPLDRGYEEDHGEELLPAVGVQGQRGVPPLRGDGLRS